VSLQMPGRNREGEVEAELGEAVLHNSGGCCCATAEPCTVPFGGVGGNMAIVGGGANGCGGGVGTIPSWKDDSGLGGAPVGACICGAPAEPSEWGPECPLLWARAM